MRSLSFILLLLFFSCSRKAVEKSTEDLIPTEIELVRIDSGAFFGPCEPSIAIDPTNPDYIVAGSILDRVHVSEDGGKTWTNSKLESTFGVYGDPVICADYNGHFYYAHLSNPNGRPYQDTAFLDRIVIQKSTDKGHNWTNGSYTLPRSPKDQDKHWLAVDPTDNSIYISWTEFDLYGSKDPSHKSRILFSKSTDQGESWTEPITLSQLEGDCIDGDQTTEGAVPCVGSNGEIYIAWSYDNRIYFDRSFDKGITWLKNDLIVSDQPGGWTFDIPGISRTNGMPITGVDRSGSKYHGRIYVNWSDQRNGTDDTDIWLAYSDDHGDNWSKPQRVNDDGPGKHQFLTWMDIDQSTGYIYFVFYDRRAHIGNHTDVYLAVSKDGGQNFQNIKLSKNSFEPDAMIFFGDYNDISVINLRVRPIWTELNGARLSIWTALIN